MFKAAREMSLLALVVGALVLCLGVTAPAQASTITFNTGIDLWLSSSGVADSGNPNLGWGHNSGSNPRNYVSLIQFTDMFGTDPGHIPLDSTINSATLYIWIQDRVGQNSKIYQMTTAWDATDTWNTIGGGLLPGTNTEAAPEVAWTGAASGWLQRTFDLTNSVQDWSDGADAYGWGFIADFNKLAVTAISMDYSTASYRPYLVVDFTEPSPDPDQGDTPEPGTMLLMGSAFAGLTAIRRRFKKK